MTSSTLRNAIAVILLASMTSAATAPDLSTAAADARRNLLARYGEAESARIERGVGQVARLWRADDGDAAAFQAFVEAEFVPSGDTLDRTFARFEEVMESLDGYFTAMVRDLRRGSDLDLGPLLPVDRRLAGFSPAAHLGDDLFGNRVAFVVLLNFPLTSLEQRLAEGGEWTRRQWAEARLAQRFASRLPADVVAAQTAAYAAADSYINDYNIFTHHLLTDDGRRLFPAGQRLISHWNLRDELKAAYSDPDGLPRQRMIARVMERIVTQQIPAVVVNNPLVDWNPVSNALRVSDVRDADPPEGARAEANPEREPDERYRQWLRIFHAEQGVDAYSPDQPTFVARRFEIDREIPEDQVRALFESVLASPLGARVGALVAERLGRPLEPFDIWYAGFKPRSKWTEAELDAVTRNRYPSVEAYARDIPRLLRDLGFSPDKAAFVSERIVVEPSRGAGHAMGAGRRDDSAHLRTRVGADGMDYKGYNIAVHEMGHNVEQVFSMTTIDHTLLEGVPNTAFTEAMAFVFQGRDLELLGLDAADPEAARLKALETFWATREIAAVALVDMAAWDWLYEHPQATPAEFREAVVAAAHDVWNRYFAEVFEVRDVPLLAIYSHMVDGGMYTPDYPLGHLIAFQIEAHFDGSEQPFGAEFERMAKIGSITPDAWMRQAVGSPISAEPMLAATAVAVETR